MNKYDTNIENTRNNNMGKNMNIQQNPYINQNNLNNNSQMMSNNQSSVNSDLIKGALIGAGITFLLTNKNAQNTIMNAVSKGNEFFQAGMEELKERYEDMKAQKEAVEEF